MTPAVEALLRPTVRMARLLWFAQTMAVPVYCLVGWFLTAEQAPQPVAQPLPVVLTVMAAFSAVAVLVFARFFPPAVMVRQVFTRDLSPEGLAAALSPNRIDSSFVDSLRPLSLEERQTVLAGRLFSLANVIRLALAESVAIYGFALTFLTRTFEPVLYFAVPALLLLILCFPRLEPFMERIEALRRG